eukprot:156636_1
MIMSCHILAVCLLLAICSAIDFPQIADPGRPIKEKYKRTHMAKDLKIFEWPGSSVRHASPFIPFTPHKFQLFIKGTCYQYTRDKILGFKPCICRTLSHKLTTVDDINKMLKEAYNHRKSIKYSVITLEEKKDPIHPIPKKKRSKSCPKKPKSGAEMCIHIEGIFDAIDVEVDYVPEPNVELFFEIMSQAFIDGTNEELIEDYIAAFDDFNVKSYCEENFRFMLRIHLLRGFYEGLSREEIQEQMTNIYTTFIEDQVLINIGDDLSKSFKEASGRGSGGWLKHDDDGEVMNPFEGIWMEVFLEIKRKFVANPIIQNLFKLSEQYKHFLGKHPNWGEICKKRLGPGCDASAAASAQSEYDNKYRHYLSQSSAAQSIYIPPISSSIGSEYNDYNMIWMMIVIVVLFAICCCCFISFGGFCWLFGYSVVKIQNQQ